jgi:hypothetical protein
VDPDRKRDKEFKDALSEARSRGDDGTAGLLPDAPTDYDKILVEKAREGFLKKF